MGLGLRHRHSGLTVSLISVLEQGCCLSSFIQHFGCRASKAAVVASIGVVMLLRKGTDTYSQIKLLNPIRFGGSESAYNFLFVGTAIIPYFVVVLILSIVYVAVLWLIMRLSYKKYYIN